MIKKDFWINLAGRWAREDDGLPPVPPPGPIKELDLYDDVDPEIDDILADLGLDDF